MKVSPKNLVVQIDINSDEILACKKYMYENYGNTYLEPAHLTLLIDPISQEYIDDCLVEIKSYLGNLKSFSFELIKITADTDDHFFYIEVSNSDYLTKLHLSLLAIAEKYRNGYIRNKDYLKIQNGLLTNEEIEFINKNGFLRNGMNYNPHFTLGEINITTEIDSQKIISELSRILGKFQQLIEVESIKVIYGAEGIINDRIIENVSLNL